MDVKIIYEERIYRKEQSYILENANSFNLRDIFECGQCFRWNKEDDESYIGVIENNVLNVKNIENKIIFKGICNGNIQEIVTNYFDLNRDYTKIKNELSKIDDYMKNSIKYGEGSPLYNFFLHILLLSKTLLNS